MSSTRTPHARVRTSIISSDGLTSKQKDHVIFMRLQLQELACSASEMLGRLEGRSLIMLNTVYLGVLVF